MDHSLVILIIQVVIAAATYFIGKHILPNVSQDTIDNAIKGVNLIVDYADKFVHYAKQFMKKNNGPEKMDEVVKQLTLIASKYNINISEVEIRAIAQKAYDSMKAGQEAAETEKAKAQAIAPILIPTDAVTDPGTLLTGVLDATISNPTVYKAAISNTEN